MKEESDLIHSSLCLSPHSSSGNSLLPLYCHHGWVHLEGIMSQFNRLWKGGRGVGALLSTPPYAPQKYPVPSQPQERTGFSQASSRCCWSLRLQLAWMHISVSLHSQKLLALPQLGWAVSNGTGSKRRSKSHPRTLTTTHPGTEASFQSPFLICFKEDAKRWPKQGWTVF